VWVRHRCGCCRGWLGSYVGAAANLFSIDARCVAEAVAAHPVRKLVLFKGKIVARRRFHEYADHGCGCGHDLNDC
jgi:hypothetical protein